MRSKKNKAELIEDWIGRNVKNILYVVGSIIWAVILLALFSKNEK